MKIVPLEAEQAHIKFRLTLDDQIVKFVMNWLEQYGYYTVDIFVNDAILVGGRALHPDVNILDATGFSRELKIQGEQPTPKNLTVSNKLVLI